MKHSPKVLAKALAKHGRKGDTVLAHINPQEAKLLDRITDGVSINPITGLPEFADSGEAGATGDYGGGGAAESGSGGYGGDAEAEAAAAEAEMGLNDDTDVSAGIGGNESPDNPGGGHSGRGDEAGVVDTISDMLDPVTGWMQNPVNLAKVVSGIPGIVTAGNALADFGRSQGWDVDDTGSIGPSGDNDGGSDQGPLGTDAPSAQTAVEQQPPVEGWRGNRTPNAGYTRGGLPPQVILRAIEQQRSQDKQAALARALEEQTGQHAIANVKLPGNY
jgi:hypothetical protein